MVSGGGKLLLEIKSFERGFVIWSRDGRMIVVVEGVDSFCVGVFDVWMGERCGRVFGYFEKVM